LRPMSGGMFWRAASIFRAILLFTVRIFSRKTLKLREFLIHFAGIRA
jgi:hypothetical protein